MTPQEESDQLPEEQPGGAGGDQDTPGSGSRDEATKNEGGGDDSGDEGEGQATGNPANAG